MIIASRLGRSKASWISESAMGFCDDTASATDAADSVGEIGDGLRARYGAA